MEDLNPRALPLDLVLSIAIYCPRSKLPSLAALNKSCYHALVPTIYQNIHLIQAKTIISFCDTIITGQLLLRSYPISIHIEPAPAPTNDLKSLGQPIRRMLSFVPNLLNLTLLVPDDITSNILNPSLDHSFMLTRLAVRVVLGLGFYDFLNHQEHIEDIVLKVDTLSADQCRVVNLAALLHLNPRALPLLKRADGFFLLFDRLNLNLSLKEVYLRGPVPLFLFTELVDRISSTWAPLTRLGVDLDVMRWSSRTEIREALLVLARLGRSLEDLKIRLFIRGEDHTAEALELLGPSYKPSHGLDEIRELLSPFTALRNFEFTSSEGTGPPANRLPAPELSQFDLWQTSCPTLERVSIYEIVLSAK